MYDIKKRKSSNFCTVSELIDILKECPKDAMVLCCGDDLVCIHVESDGSVINIDNETLDEVYEAYGEELEYE